MSRLLSTGLLLLALVAAGTASAARQAHWERVEALHQTGLLGRGGKMTDDPVIIAVKYDVPPSMHDDFFKAWRKLQDKTFDEKGMITYDLAKTRDTNVYFWTYGEWEDMEKYFDHFNSRYTCEFLDFLDDNDIKYEMFPLKNIADNTKKGGKTSLSRRAGKASEDPRKGPVHYVIQYHVPPSMTTDFMDAWTDIAARTWDEKENIIYALHKVGTMNHHFIAYGSWESFDGYLDHHISKHMRKMHDFMADNDIMWFLEPVMKLGDEPEEKI